MNLAKLWLVLWKHELHILQTQFLGLYTGWLINSVK